MGALKGSLPSLAPTFHVQVFCVFFFFRAEAQSLVLRKTSDMEEETHHSSSVKLLLFQMQRILGA